MAQDLLDPMKDSREKERDPNASQRDYDEKFNSIVNSPENKAFADQANDKARDSFSYLPDSDRKQLQDKERGAGGQEKTNPELEKLSESGALSDPGKPETEQSVKRWSIKGVLRNKKIQGVLVGGGATGMLIAMFLGVQPFQIIHVMKSLQGMHLSRNERTQDTSIRRLRNIASNQREENRLSALGAAVATKQRTRLEAQGFSFEYKQDGQRFRRSILQSITVPDTPEGKRLLEIAERNNMTIDGLKIDTRGTQSIPGLREMSRVLVEIDGKTGLSGRISYRRQIKLVGANFRPMNIAKRKLEDMTDYKNRRADTKAEEHKSNRQTKALGTGKSTDPETGAEVDTGKGEAASTSNTVDEIKDEKSASKRKVKIKAFKVAGGAAAVAGILCAAKDVGDNITDYKVMNNVIPLVNMTWDIIATGSQVMAGENVTADEVAAVMDSLYDPETKSAWNAAAPFVQANGGEGGVAIDPSTKTQIDSSLNGDKPAFFDILDNIPGIGTVCKASNWFDNVPVLREINQFTGNMMNTVASTLTGKSIDDYMQDLVGVLAGDTIDTLARGASFGNLISYGGRLIGNIGSIAIGGSVLTSAQAREWRDYERELKIAERKEKSIWSRYFDIRDTDSISSVALFRSPALVNTQSLVDSFKNIPSFALSSGKTFASSTLRTTNAQSVDANNYDYGDGLPEYGIPLSVLNSDRYVDIYENIDRFENNNYALLKQANSQWGHCFGNPIDDNGVITDKPLSENTDVYKKISDDSATCSQSSQEFRDYQIYINDNVAIKSMACYEGVDGSACAEIGFENSSNNSSPSSSNTGGSIIGDPYTDTTSVACATGTKDIGLQDAYVSGRMFKSRMCSVSNIPSSGQADNPGSQYSTPGAEGKAIVNSRVSGAWYKLAEDAKAAGINFSVGSSFRSMAHQQSLFKGDTSAVARPGYSSHQAGVALDFQNMRGPGVKSGATCSNRAKDGGQGYKWLEANASKYGFKQYAAEAWHWDALNAASRC